MGQVVGSLSTTSVVAALSGVSGTPAARAAAARIGVAVRDFSYQFATILAAVSRPPRPKARPTASAMAPTIAMNSVLTSVVLPAAPGGVPTETSEKVAVSMRPVLCAETPIPT